MGPGVRRDDVGILRAIVRAAWEDRAHEWRGVMTDAQPVIACDLGALSADWSPPSVPSGSASVAALA